MLDSRTGRAATAVLLTLLGATGAPADVISGTVSDWPQNDLMAIGDGTHHVTMMWSLTAPDAAGYFYGSLFTGDSNVAEAAGVTQIGQITNAGSYAFDDLFVGPGFDAENSPDGVGDFIVWKNIDTGHYGVLRIDDISGGALSPRLAGTWWFQTNGTGDFSPPPPCKACDTNCDGSVNGFDIQSFRDLLSGSGSSCSPCAGDTNDDGSINGFDIEAFLDCLKAP